MNDLNRINIVIADESELFRNTWARTLEGNDVYGVATKAELHKILRSQQPDILIYDLYFSSESFELTMSEILQISPATKVVVLSFDTHSALANLCISAGAKGFFNKYVNNFNSFADLLKKIYRGQTINETYAAA